MGPLMGAPTVREIRQFLTAVEAQEMSVRDLRRLLFEVEAQDQPLKGPFLTFIRDVRKGPSRSLPCRFCGEQTSSERWSVDDRGEVVLGPVCEGDARRAIRSLERRALR